MSHSLIAQLQQALSERRRHGVGDSWFVLAPSVFAVPHGDDYLIYAPIQGCAALVNEAGFASVLLGDSRFLENSAAKIVQGLKSVVVARSHQGAKNQATPGQSDAFHPVKLMLSLTSACQLACTYCYIQGGDNPRNMPWEIAETAIRFVADNCCKRGITTLGITFHGQGEPTAVWPLFTDAVALAEIQAQERGLTQSLSVVTNGILDDRKVGFLVDHGFNISVSMDTFDQQVDHQRPMRSGGSTSERIKKTLQTLDKLDAIYTVQSTVTPETLPTMVGFVNWIAESTQCRRISFEPVFKAGRAAKEESRVRSTHYPLFTQNLIHARDEGKTLGIDVHYSGCTSHAIRSSHCGAYGAELNFCVSTDGAVSSCYEVLEESDLRSSLFMYGRYDANVRCFEFDDERVQRLRGLTVNSLDRCSDCYVRWSCAGDCLANAMIDAPVQDIETITESERCQANRLITVDQLVRTITYSRSGVPT